MSEPLLWILAPALGGVLTGLVHDLRVKALAGASLLACLALLAWKLPAGAQIQLGPLAFQLSGTLEILGRRFALTAGDRPSLILIYLLVALWYLGAPAARTTALLIPAGLGMVACLVAALMVEPFLFAALLIELAVLLSLPILAPPGSPIGRGVLRFLIFQTLAMPFILFTGWMLTGVESGLADPDLVRRASLLLGLGFAFLLAIVPFYSWIPLLADEGHPYTSGFIFMLLPTVTMLFGVNFLDRYAWLRSWPELYRAIQLAGVIMIISGGVGVIFQRHLGRIMGYAIIAETGFSLLAVSAGTPAGLQVFTMLFLPRAVSLLVWSLALAVLKEQVGGLADPAIRGAARRYPIPVAALLAANFSLAGLPLLADFPAKMALWEALAQGSLAPAMWAILGSALLLAGGIRSMAVLVDGEGWAFHPGLGRERQILLVTGALALLAVGLLPQVFLPPLVSILGAFTNLVH